MSLIQPREMEGVLLVDKRRVERIARETGMTQKAIVRQWIALDERGRTPSDGLTRGETGASVPTTTRGE